MKDKENIIKKYRVKRGITQETLGKMLGVSRVAVSHLENGVLFPKTSRIIKLSDILKCPVDKLLRLKR